MCRKAVEPLVVDMYQAEGITAAPNSVSLLNLLKRALVALQSPMSLRLPHCDFQMITSDASFSNDLGYLAYCATQSLEALTRPLSDRTVFMFLFPSVQFLPFKSVVCASWHRHKLFTRQILVVLAGCQPFSQSYHDAFAAHVLATKTNSNPSQKQIEETLDANFAFLNKHSAGKSDRMLVADEFLTGVSFSNQLMARITIQEYGVEPEMGDRRSGQNAIL
ncbi:hypothetical protein BDR26DRAFT_879231 [Obelidium mucronatum]|nr:hypothetical protein BDR26DRAFT_879231 [Obelidium mucronatum]